MLEELKRSVLSEKPKGWISALLADIFTKHQVGFIRKMLKMAFYKKGQTADPRKNQLSPLT